MSRQQQALRYDEDRWSGSRRVVLVRPHLWRWIDAVVEDGPVLEIGPGLRPTAPVEGSYFVDRSTHALARLAAHGGLIAPAGRRLSFPSRCFGAVLAFEVLEHVEDDDTLFAEIARVLRPGGLFVLSTPIRMSLWSDLDEACGHFRRYEVDELFGKLRTHGFQIEGYASVSNGSPILSRVRARILRANRPIATAFVQALVFPVQAAYHRSLGTVRWASPDSPVPVQAGDLMVYGRATRRR